MITLTYQDERPQVTQVMKPPVVYLDHWALMDIADNAVLSDMFARGLAAKGGTWALSWVNIAEFLNVSEAAHARNAEALVERVRPNLFFIEPNMFEVIARENELLKDSGGMVPHADGQLLTTFVGQDSSSLDPLSAAGIFSAVASSNPRSCLNELGRIVAERVCALRAQYEADDALKKRMDAPTTGPRVPAGTRYLMRDVLALATKNQGFVFDKNHAIDFVHAVVPCAYCDYVLLDGHWVAQIDQARKRLHDAGHRFPVARVYSRRTGGVGHFLEDVAS